MIMFSVDIFIGKKPEITGQKAQKLLFQEVMSVPYPKRLH